MKKIICIVGNQRAGKTYMSQMLQSISPHATLLNLGEEIRKLTDVETFANSENPYAPFETEKFVQDTLRHYLDVELVDGYHDILIIDSAPRNLEQFNIIKSYRGSDVELAVLSVVETFDVRRGRALEKYNSPKYFDTRERFERCWLINFKKLCNENNIPFYTIYKDGNV